MRPSFLDFGANCSYTLVVKLTIQLRLLPDSKQRNVLLRTMEQFNAAASFAARVGFADGVFSQPSIHYRCYQELRKQFGLSAQMAVRAIGKAVEVFRRDKSRCPSFKPHGAVTYDERILSFKGLDTVSLWALNGRMRIPLLYGEYQKRRFDRIQGQADLVYRDGKFFLYATINLPPSAPVNVGEFLGVDLGIVNLAVDSDGKTYSGSDVEVLRRRQQRNRQRLQRRDTRGAKKVLRRFARREARFRKHTNHCISKQVVRSAKDTGRGIALENLRGIRSRITVRRKQRARHHNWAFAQLRSFIEYKAKLAGIPVVIVEARNSSRTCSRCGHCEKANRQNQSMFHCRHCGYSVNADFNAALNLVARAACKSASKLAGAAA